MNSIRSLLSYCLPRVTEPYHTSQPISPENTSQPGVIALTNFDSQVEANNNAFWEGRTVDQMVTLPECTYTSLKSLELPTATPPLSTVWDRAKSSPNIHIQDSEPTKLHRRPIAQSTDLAMSDTGFFKGTHILEVEWPTTMRGSHAVIGVAMQEMPLKGTGYTNLLGSTESSWGWDIKRNVLLHNDQILGNYPRDKPKKTFTAPEKIKCIIDMGKGILGFKIDDTYLGDAFTELKGKTVFLAVSAVWGNAEIKVQYITGEKNYTPLSLQAITKLSLRSLVSFEEQALSLPIPPPLQRYIADKETTDSDNQAEENDQHSI